MLSRLNTTLLLLSVFTGAFIWANSAAAAPGPQDLADRTEVWLAHTLHVEPQRRRVVLASPTALAQCSQLQQVRGRGGCAAFATPGTIALGSEVYLGAIDAAIWPSPYTPYALPFQVLLHELLHRDGGDDLLEEGLVDALAFDLMPAASSAVIGLRMRPHAALYGPEVHLVRKASALACGCDWRERGARGLRRAWWGAPNEVRHQVVAEALALGAR